MTNAQSTARLILAGLFFCTSAAIAAAQATTSSPKAATQELFLTLRDNGLQLSAIVGQPIQITLGAMAVCDPQISSPAIHFENVALKWPPTPGIATYFYIFEAATQGEAQIRIPISDCANPDAPEGLTFAVTIRVEPAAGQVFAPYISNKPDQVNAAPWQDAWTNLLNPVAQTFTPSLPQLTAIEVQLIVGNPGPLRDTVSLTLLDAEGQVLALVSKTVAPADCGQVLFVLPNGGLLVSPGQTYRIQLSGGRLFGWKYTSGGYKNGHAWLNDRRQLVADTRTSFLFRTFGAN